MRLRLSDFTPFRLNRLAGAVSEDLSQVYRARFGLEIPEWRTLVTIAGRSDVTAQRIVASTRMHKTRVSRAVASMHRRGLIRRAGSPVDARIQVLLLTAAGRRLYDALVPLALEREREILGRMTAAERRGFLEGVARLESALGLQDE